VLFAYDVAQAIDLEGAAKMIREPSRAGTLGRTHPAPSDFQFSPPPLRVALRGEPERIGAWSTLGEIELVLYDYGVVLVSHGVPLRGDLEEAVELSCTLLTDDALAQASRRRVAELVARLAGHLHKPGIAAVVEDYQVFRFPERMIGGDADAYVARNGPDLARVLRGERRMLSRSEVADALSERLQYEPGDLALIDWNAALVFDDQPEDVLRVLEYANTQLLELRFLDARLDADLERAWKLLSKKRKPLLGPFALRRDLDRVSAMQVDGTILFERAGNTLKVSGDPYLARVLRRASSRFKLEEWTAGTLRKLKTLDDFYEKIHDHASTLRAEFLEWAIVILIVIDILLSLAGH
jgi:hypothetical protein